MTGTLVGFVHDPNSVIESAVGIGIGAYGSVQGNTALPPVGSAIELIVEVPPAKKMIANVGSAGRGERADVMLAAFIQVSRTLQRFNLGAGKPSACRLSLPQSHVRGNDGVARRGYGPGRAHDEGPDELRLNIRSGVTVRHW